jgi:hypothetical protein
MSNLAAIHPDPQLSNGASAHGDTVVESVEASVLDRIGDERIQMAIWIRALPHGLEQALSSWARSSPARFQSSVCIEEPRLECVARGLPEPHRSWILADLRAELRRFGAATGATQAQLWFGAVRDDQCRKFHVDYIAFRMISTYSGPGTEWVPEWAVDRAALDHPPECPCDANQAIVRDPSAIRTARVGEVMLMKGFGHPTGRGVVHRSPPIETTEQIRVTMTLSLGRAPRGRAPEADSMQ